jgi:hypothetical protein
MQLHDANLYYYNLKLLLIIKSFCNTTDNPLGTKHMAQQLPVSQNVFWLDINNSFRRRTGIVLNI